MTAILVRFEWHGDCPRSGAGPPHIPSTPRRQTTGPCNRARLSYALLSEHTTTRASSRGVGRSSGRTVRIPCARWAAVSQLRHLERAFTQTSLGPGAMVIFDVPDPAMAPAMCGVAVSSGSIQNVELTRLFSMEEIADIRQKARQIHGAYKPPGQR